MKGNRSVLCAVVSWVTLAGCQSSPGGPRDPHGDRDATIVTADGGANIDARWEDLGDDVSDDAPPGDDPITAGELIDTIVAEEDSHRR